MLDEHCDCSLIGCGPLIKGELTRKNNLPLKNNPAFEKSNDTFDASHRDSVKEKWHFECLPAMQ